MAMSGENIGYLCFGGGLLALALLYRFYRPLFFGLIFGVLAGWTAYDGSGPVLGIAGGLLVGIMAFFISGLRGRRREAGQ